jgi:hypothetical protein
MNTNIEHLEHDKNNGSEDLSWMLSLIGIVLVVSGLALGAMFAYT